MINAYDQFYLLWTNTFPSLFTIGRFFFKQSGHTGACWPWTIQQVLLKMIRVLTCKAAPGVRTWNGWMGSETNYLCAVLIPQSCSMMLPIIFYSTASLWFIFILSRSPQMIFLKSQNFVSAFQKKNFNPTTAATAAIRRCLKHTPAKKRELPQLLDPCCEFTLNIQTSWILEGFFLICRTIQTTRPVLKFVQMGP